MSATRKGDTVRILTGALAGRTGAVQHIHPDFFSGRPIYDVALPGLRAAPLPYDADELEPAPSLLVLVDCEHLADATKDTVVVPLIRFAACTCQDFDAAIAGKPCPRHQPEEYAVLAEVCP